MYLRHWFNDAELRAFLLIGIGIALVLFPSLQGKILERDFNKNLVTKIPAQIPLTPIPTPPDQGPFKPQKALLQNTKIPAELPVRIIIPQLKIDLPVKPAKIVAGRWELSETTASFGLGSAPPNLVGNSVIFAHARRGLFLPLRKIKQGMLIYVLTARRWYIYKATKIHEVLPTDTEVIKATVDKRLTLYTCSGYADRKRLIVVGKPVL